MLQSFSCQEDGVTLGRPLMDFSSDDLRQYVECISLTSTEGLVNRNTSKVKPETNSQIELIDFLKYLKNIYQVII